MKSRAKIHEFMGRYTDGAASAEDMCELEAAMRADVALRMDFLRYMNLDAALASGAAISPRARQTVGRFSLRRRTAYAAAAVLLIGLTIPATILWSRRDRGVGADEAKPNATLVAAQNAVWSDPNTELALRGGEFPDTAIQLESGVAEFLLRDGAAVVIGGPASFQFRGAKRIFLEEGRLFCRCPTPESRISVETPVTEVIDLGTEFAVEVRADRSTRVAVLSGEVQVGRNEARHLRKDEGVEVRSDGLLVVRGFSREEFADLRQSTSMLDNAVQSVTNQLRDPGFDRDLQADGWSGTDPNLAVTSAGRNGAGIRIAAAGAALWPQCRQKLATGDISGKLLVASVWAASAVDQPLMSPQFAILKLAFVNEQGREFAFAKRHLLAAPSVPGRFESTQLAVLAPAGTYGVQFQLILNAHTYGRGAAIFDDASLSIADAPHAP